MAAGSEKVRSDAEKLAEGVEASGLIEFLNDDRRVFSQAAPTVHGAPFSMHLAKRAPGWAMVVVPALLSGPEGAGEDWMADAAKVEGALLSAVKVDATINGKAMRRVLSTGELAELASAPRLMSALETLVAAAKRDGESPWSPSRRGGKVGRGKSSAGRQVVGAGGKLVLALRGDGEAGSEKTIAGRHEAPSRGGGGFGASKAVVILKGVDDVEDCTTTLMRIIGSIEPSAIGADKIIFTSNDPLPGVRNAAHLWSWRIDDCDVGGIAGAGRGVEGAGRGSSGVWGSCKVQEAAREGGGCRSGAIGGTDLVDSVFPVDRAWEEEANLLADLIAMDLAARRHAGDDTADTPGGLKDQRAESKLGERLVKALPVTFVRAAKDGVRMFRIEPLLAPRVAPDSGQFAKFRATVEASFGDRARALSIEQVSGGGKTKLAFSLGTVRPLVLIRPMKTSVEKVRRGKFAPVWEVLEQQLVEGAGDADTLLACVFGAHLMWSRAVISRVEKQLRRKLGVEEFNYALLTSHRNGRADEGTRLVFQSRNVRAMLVDVNAVITALLESLRKPCVFVDEAQFLHAKFLGHFSHSPRTERVHSSAVPSPFSSSPSSSTASPSVPAPIEGRVSLAARAVQVRSTAISSSSTLLSSSTPSSASASTSATPSAPAAAARTNVDLLEATRRVAATVLSAACPFVYAGTYLDMDNKPDLTSPPGTPSRAPVQVVPFSVLITAEDMLRALQHYIRLEADEERRLRTAFAKLEGRPLFFFDWVFCQLFPWNVDAIVAIVDEVYRASVNLHCGLFAQLGHTFETDTLLSRNCALLESLFRALVLGGGKYVVTAEDLHTVVRTSVTPVVHAKEGMWEVDFNWEPIAAEAIRRAGVEVFSKNVGKFLRFVDPEREARVVNANSDYALERMVALVFCLGMEERSLAEVLRVLGLTDTEARSVPLLGKVMVRSKVARLGLPTAADKVRIARLTGDYVGGDGGERAPDGTLYWRLRYHVGRREWMIDVQLRFYIKAGETSLLEALQSLQGREHAEQVTVRILVTLSLLSAGARRQLNAYNALHPLEPVVVVCVADSALGPSMARSKSTAVRHAVSALAHASVRVLGLDGEESDAFPQEEVAYLGVLGRDDSSGSPVESAVALDEETEESIERRMIDGLTRIVKRGDLSGGQESMAVCRTRLPHPAASLSSSLPVGTDRPLRESIRSIAAGMGATRSSSTADTRHRSISPILLRAETVSQHGRGQRT